MDSKGNILTPEQVAALSELERKELGLIPIPDDQVDRLKGMNHEQRRAWHADQRRMNRRRKPGR